MNRRTHTIAGAFEFLLLGVFALSATMLVLMGVRFYRAQAQQADAVGEYRILSSYLRSMTRAMDESGVVSTDHLDGIDVLTMKETYDGWEYLTRIYVWDGRLREWFSDASYPFDPAQGEEICEAKDLQLQMEDGLLRVRVTGTDDREAVSVIALRSEVEEK